MPGIPESETGWLPDLLYTGGRFESGVAMFAGGDGRITRLSRDPADVRRAARLAGRAMLPGLVNAHSHAFQRALRGRTEYRSRARSGACDDFWTWRERMHHAANRLSPEDLYAAGRMAFLEMLLSGITTVGEFHYVHHAPGGAPYGDRNRTALELVRAAADTGLRIALLRAAYARAGWRKPADPLQARFLTPRAEEFIADTEALRTALRQAAHPERAWIGVAPHSVRALPLDYLREVFRYARDRDLPIHMHVAEQPGEIAECMEEYGMRPVALLHHHGLLGSRFTAVHAIHITLQAAGYLAAAKSRVCACPTTERNLGDGAVPADVLADAGTPVCFGSDSNVQIDLLEDARSLEYHLRMNKLQRAVLAPDATAGADAPEDALARRLFAGATETGAASLCGGGGSLRPGLLADFFTVDLDDPSIAGASAASLLNQVVFSLERSAVREVAVGGEFVIRDSRHPRQEEIVREFAGLQRRLWGAEY